jgi:hypothetical protein
MSPSIRRIFLLTAAAMAVAACSSTPPRERMANNLAEYRAAAGEPVASFWFRGLKSWEPLGEEHVVIRTGPRDIYLLTVERPCNELPWALSISITSSNSRVYARFDNVIVREQRCRIQSIQPVDRDALRQAQQAGKLQD